MSHTRVSAAGCARRAAAAGVLAASAGLAGAQQPPGQDSGPVIVGEKKNEYNWWDLRSFNAALELYGEFHDDRYKQAGQPDTHVREDILRATTHLSFESYIGHKNLVDLTGDFHIGYEDQKVNSSLPDQDLHDSPFTDLYNVQALVLGASPYPLRLYSHRDETLTHREFTSSLRTTTAEHGAILELQSDAAPTRLQFYHRDQDQSESFGRYDYTSAQDTFDVQNRWKLTDRQRLEIDYTYDHIDEKQSATNFHDVYDRHDGTFTHYINFGDDNLDYLRSSFRLYSIGGLTDLQSYRLDEQMLLHHTPRLESRYNLSLEDQTIQGQQQRLVAGNGELRHKLFDSLISRVGGGGDYLQVPGEFDSSNLFVQGTLDYTKHVPYGRVDASVGLRFNHQDNSERGSDFFVSDESHTFNDPADVVISRRNVVESSIVVIDPVSRIPYVLDADYTVTASPAEVRIRRVATGNILNGQTVLVSYSVGPEPGSQIDTTSQLYSFRYTIDEGWLSGLSLYGIYQQIDNTLNTVDPSLFILDDIRDIRYGAEYTIGNYSFLAENQNHQSTVSPYDRYRLEARYNRRISRDSTISAEAVREVIDYKNNSDHVELNRILGRWNQRVSSQLDVSLYLQYRDERSSVNGHSQGFEQAVELHWHLRQTSAFASFRNSMLDGDNSSRLSQTLTIGLTRSF